MPENKISVAGSLVPMPDIVKGIKPKKIAIGCRAKITAAGILAPTAIKVNFTLTNTKSQDIAVKAVIARKVFGFLLSISKKLKK
ncbi:MAG: hypothetical protein PHQ47_00730 [Candidatus Portnoybacteria bacterium]|nr:hypothetical protein [Candidatus Portnoybacteria bacterium]